MSNESNRRPWVKDAALSFVGGVNSAVPPHVIGRDQVVNAVNATCRGGRIKPRPGFALKELTFSATTTAQFVIPALGATVNVSVDDCYGATLSFPAITIGVYAFTLTAINSATSITVQNDTALNAGTTVASGSTVEYNGNFESKFQGVGFYDGNGHPALLSSNGGRIWRTDLRTFHVSEITPASGRNSATKDMAWLCQAENYCIIQDNQSKAIIYDGTTARRADDAQREVPVGNIMAYEHGRLIVALPNEIDYRIGDLVFSSSGTAANSYRDAILKFTENEYANEGGDMTTRIYGANSTHGKIRSITPVAQTNTQLGQGPVMIGQPKMVFTVSLPFDRTTWKDLNSPMQTASPIPGPLGHRSTVNVNGDLWYRSIDGVRSYIMAIRDSASQWSTTPMSAEVNETLSYDSEHLLIYSSAAVFDNRLLMTVSPANDSMGIFHRGLAVIDFNPVSTMRGKASPAWDGIWNGLRILQIISCFVDHKERCFIYALNDASRIELWEIIKDQKEDHDNTPIAWSIDMRSMDCGNVEQFKRLETGRLVIRNLWGTLDYTVEYKSDQAPCWQSWDSGQVCAKKEDCGTFACTGPRVYREQQRSNIRLKQPADGFDEISGWKYRTGYQFQPRIEFSGYCELEAFWLYAIDEPESLSSESII